MLQITNQQTMSSREIAELTDKQHKHVLDDIRKLLNELELSTAEFSAMYKADNGQAYECFNLPKRECLILVSGYSIALRAKIIDRWQELENKQPKIPTNFIEAMTLALEQAKQLELQAPKVQAFDALIGADTIFSMNQTAKLLGWGRNKLFAELRKRHILMDSNLPYQAQLDNGRFVVKDTPIQRSIGTMVVSQSYVTTKGQVWLSKLLNAVNNG